MLVGVRDARGTGSAAEFYPGPGAPLDIVTGADGDLWFTERGDRIGRLTPTGSLTVFHAGIAAGAEPFGIAAGADGNIWFSERNLPGIARITPAGKVTQVPTGAGPGSYPIGIVAGPDGALWYAEQDDHIVRVTTSGSVTRFSAGITAGSQPNMVALGPDGDLWFTEAAGDRIGRITPTGVVTEFSVGMTAGGHPYGITAGPDGNMWFTDPGGNSIGRITPMGVIREFSAGISANAAPNQIVAGPDGNLWFTEILGDRVARITPSGTVTEFATLPKGSQPQAITVGPDGALWIAETGPKGRVARLSLAPLTPVLARTVGVTPISGRVLVREPGAHGFVPLTAVTLLPVGSTINTTNGRVRLTAAAAAGPATYTGEFYDGQFGLTQARKGPTALTLTGGIPCTSGAARSAKAGPRPRQRKLWGDAHGSFTTIGTDAAASDLGTRWLTEDTCTGTLIQVAQGQIRVHDFIHHRTVVVHAPHSYLAHR